MPQFLDKISSFIALLTATLLILSALHDFVRLNGIDYRLFYMLTIEDVTSTALFISTFLVALALFFIALAALAELATAKWWKDTIAVILIFTIAAWGGYVGTSYFDSMFASTSGQGTIMFLLGIVLVALFAVAVQLASLARTEQRHRQTRFALFLAITLTITTIWFAIIGPETLDKAERTTLVLKDGTQETAAFIAGISKGAVFWSPDQQKTFFLPWEEIKRF